MALYVKAVVVQHHHNITAAGITLLLPSNPTNEQLCLNLSALFLKAASLMTIYHEI